MYVNNLYLSIQNPNETHDTLTKKLIMENFFMIYRCQPKWNAKKTTSKKLPTGIEGT